MNAQGGIKHGIKIEKTFYEKLGIVTLKATDVNKLGFIRLQVKRSVYDEHDKEIEKLMRDTLNDLIKRTKEDAYEKQVLNESA